jgi:hypothetical protein
MNVKRLWSPAVAAVAAIIALSFAGRRVFKGRTGPLGA